MDSFSAVNIDWCMLLVDYLSNQSTEMQKWGCGVSCSTDSSCWDGRRMCSVNKECEQYA